MRDNFVANREDFVSGVVDPPFTLLPVVLFVAHTRGTVRSRGEGPLLTQLRRTPRRNCRAEALLRSAWSMCRVLLQFACPRRPQPVVEAGDVPLG